MRNDDLDRINLRPISLELARQLGKRETVRFRRTLNRVYRRTHALLAEVGLPGPDPVASELLALQASYRENLERAKVAVRLADCMPASLLGVRVRVLAKDNLDVAEEFGEVLYNIECRLRRKSA